MYKDGIHPSVGKKYDSGKPRYSLIPPLALEEVVKSLTYGSKKYGDFNWQKLDNPSDRLFSACMRHLWSYKQGTKLDEEQGVSHLAAAMANILFMLELDLKKTT